MSAVFEVTGLGLRNRGFERRVAPFLAAGVFALEDVLVVDAVAERFGERDPEVLCGLAFAVRAPRAGHAGVDLVRVSAHIEVPEGREALGPAAWPADRVAWLEQVCGSPMVARAGAPEAAMRPFTAQEISGGHTLVLTRRMYVEQERVAEALLTRARAHAEHIPADLEAGLARLFGAEAGGEAAAAVRVAARSRLTLVTGGPGTGKTYSIKRLLALLCEGSPSLRVELAAPTGKAAVRMAEAMGEALDELAVDDATKARLRGLAPRTLHKLIGVRPDGSTRHHARNPIPADVVVVDEVSMVDLAMMRMVLDAVPPEARLVLLGDKDQLASVEAGSVLSDVVRAAGSGRGPLAERVVRFSKSHRFSSAPDIAGVAAGLQAGDEDGVAGAQAILCGHRHDPKEWLTGEASRIRHLGAPERPQGATEPGQAVPKQKQREQLAAPYCGLVHTTREGEALLGYAALLGEVLRREGAHGPTLRAPTFQRAVLAALDRYRVLAVHRRGPLGVAGLERDLAERVRKFLAGSLVGRALPAAGPHWLGRPLLVTENSYEVGLMNGDVGLVMPSPESAGQLVAVFPPVGGAQDAAPKIVALSRLPPHEGALAMTVHKSQGSQFDRVAIVLAGRASPIQKRELIYTAITRAKSRVDWLGDAAELERALAETVVRTSGLSELLGAGQG